MTSHYIGMKIRITVIFAEGLKAGWKKKGPRGRRRLGMFDDLIDNSSYVELKRMAEDRDFIEVLEATDLS